MPISDSARTNEYLRILSSFLEPTQPIPESPGPSRRTHVIVTNCAAHKKRAARPGFEPGMEVLQFHPRYHFGHSRKMTLMVGCGRSSSMRATRSNEKAVKLLAQGATWLGPIEI